RDLERIAIAPLLHEGGHDLTPVTLLEPRGNVARALGPRLGRGGGSRRSLVAPPRLRPGGGLGAALGRPLLRGCGRCFRHGLLPLVDALAAAAAHSDLAPVAEDLHSRPGGAVTARAHE